MPPAKLPDADTRDRHRLVGSAEFFEHDGEAERAGVRTPVRLGEGQSEEAQFGHLLHDLERERGLAVMHLGGRSDDLVGERAHDRAELLLLCRQIEVHGRPAYGTLARWVGSARPAAGLRCRNRENEEDGDG